MNSNSLIQSINHVSRSIIPQYFDIEFAIPSDWAEMYHGYGLQVVPAMHPSSGGQWKRPAIKWREHENDLVDGDTVVSWFPRTSNGQMGVVTGKCSGIFVLDLDTHKGPEALAWWRGLLAVENSDLDLETAVVTTGGGGKQYYFKTPDFWTPPTNKTAIGVDIRGQGGFVMAPPSMHESGTAYVWDEGSAPWEIDILEAPQWLCDAIDKLIGGISSERGTQVERIPGPNNNAGGIVENFFGQVVDGREQLATKMIWAAVLDWWRECPIKPPPNESAEKCREVYQRYERKAKPRLYDPATPRSILLEREGRGHTMFEEKWHRAIAQWHDRVAEAAAQPNPQKTIPHEDYDPVTGEIHGEIVEGEVEEEPDLKRLLAIEAWAIRDIPEPDRILGDFLTTTVRGFLVGRTGLGKTLLGLAIAAAAASGTDFLTWKAYRPVRVLYIDGEMPAELIKPRAIDAMRRLGDIEIPGDNLMIFGRDIEAEARQWCPALPPFAPLNTDAGNAFLMALIKAAARQSA